MSTLLNGDQIASLLYLSLLGAAVIGWMLVEGRKRMGQMMRMAAIWVFIFMGAIAAVGLWGDIRSAITPVQKMVEGRIEVPRASDGHFYLMAEVNGTDVRFVVDTGATDMVLTLRDAERVGLNPDKLAFLGQARTANGVVQTAPVRLDTVRLGAFMDQNVTASVNGGQMDGSLLGMSYLNRFTTLTISGNRLLLER